MRKKEWLRTGFFAALPALSAVLLAQLVLRNLSLFLYFDPEFSAIFAQIRDAALYTPVLLIALAVLLFWWINKRKKWIAVLAVLLWLGIFFAAVLLTKVNGIRFCDVLFSLLDVMKKGGL